MSGTGQHAVVIGGSISGLLAARALADTYTRVTVLERDTFPAVGESRKGVPQDRHAHAILSRGTQILETFFPGFSAEVVAQGGVSADIGQSMVMYTLGEFLQRVDTNAMALFASRPLLEGWVRTRLFQLPNVQAIETCDVEGIVLEGERVTGVRLVRRGAENAAEEMLAADLVVDASGRGSRLPTWLEALGYAAPRTEQLEIGITYTTATYQDHPDLLPGITGVLVNPDPATKRGAAVLRGENGWRVTLVGYLGQHAPLDELGFLEYARQLPIPQVYDLLMSAEPLTAPRHYKFPASQRRYYEQLSHLPQGLLVFGDALCSFNPVYGQGMTIATIEAELLQRCLAEGVVGAETRFFRQVGAIVDGAWNISVGSDLVFPEVQGDRTRAIRFINWYFNKVTRAAQRDATVARLYHGIINMTTPPAQIMAPAMFLRVLWQSRRTTKPTIRQAVIMVTEPLV